MFCTRTLHLNMFTVRLLTLITILISKKAASSPYVNHWPTESTWSSSESEYDEESISGESYQELCPDKEQSLLSDHDIKYSIDNIATKLEIVETLENGHYSDAEEVLYKYLHELEAFQELIVDRPTHMLHILEDMANLRVKLDPKVDEIVAQLQGMDIHVEKYNEIAERSDTLLKQFEKYKTICNINCEHSEIEPRMGHEILYHPLISSNANMSCIKLKDLNDYVTAELGHFKEEYSHDISCMIEERDNEYAAMLKDLKIDLKETAVKQFGMTMYDILSLQDYYYHFVEDLESIEISSELDKLEENYASIKFKLIGLKRDVDRYGQYCMNCNYNQRKKNQRFKRNIVYLQKESSYEDTNENNFDRSQIVDALIEDKIYEITTYIESSLQTMFEELDTEFHDPDLINKYVTKLQPIQDEIEHDIRIEQEAMYQLLESIHKSDVEQIYDLSKESENLLQILDSTKQYIDKVM